MADNKPTSQNYQNLGGVNKKTSEYNLNKTEFEDLRNLDFFVPNALTKRPGTTNIVGGFTSKVSSLTEFQFLNGTNLIFFGNPNSFNFINGTTLTNVSTGASSSAVFDTSGFVNKMWFTNGDQFQRYNESGFTTPYPKPIQSIGATGSALQWTNTPLTVDMNESPQPAVVFGAGSFSIYRVFYAGVYSDNQYGPLEYGGELLEGLDRVGGTFVLRASYFVATRGTSAVAFPIVYPPGVSRIAIFFSYNSYASDPRNIAEEAFGTAYFATSVPMGFSLNQRVFGATTIFSIATNNATYLLALGITASNSYTGVGYFYDKNILLSPTITGEDFNTDVNVNLAGGIWATYTPKYLEVSNNRMFYAGFSNVPSSVFVSELIDPVSVNLENSFEVRTNDGDVVTGMKQYNDEIMVFKRKSFYRLLGSAPSDYSLTEISREFGCLNNQTIVEFKERLAWLDRQGIVLYNGSSYEIISTPVEPIFRRMNFTAAETQACVVHHNLRNQIWFGIPIDGSEVNNITVVYDYVVQAWTFFDGFNPSSFSYIQNVGDPRVIMGDYSGFIKSYSESFFNDSGQGISTKMLTRFESNDGENSTNIYRRFFLNVQPETALTQAINVKAFADYDSTTVQATFQMFQSTFQSRAEIGVVGKSVQFEVNHFSASLPLEIDGFAIARRYLRNV